MEDIYGGDDSDEDEGGDSGDGKQWRQGGDHRHDEPTVSPRRHLFVECLTCLTVLTIIAAVMIGNVLLGDRTAGDEPGTSEQVSYPPAPASSSLAAASPPSMGTRVGPSGGEFRGGFDLDKSHPPPPPPHPPSDLAALCHVATLQTAGGRDRCRHACEPAALPCCLVEEVGINCRRQVDEEICNRYGSCKSLSVFPSYGGLGVGGEYHGDDADHETATGANSSSWYPRNESSTLDPSTLMTENDDNLFTTEELIVELCSLESLAELEGRDDCAELCLPGRCCFILALNQSSSSSSRGSGDENHQERGSTESDCSWSHGSLCDTYAGCRDLYETYGLAAGGVGNVSENSDNNSHVDSSSSAAVSEAATSEGSAGVGTTSAREEADHSVDSNASPTDVQQKRIDPDDDDGTDSTENGGGGDASTETHDDLPPPHFNTTEACAADKIADDDDGSGLEGCRTACAEGACCYADVDGPFNCRSSGGGRMEEWCVAYYLPCQVLKGLPNDGEGGPFGGGATSSPQLAVMGRLWSEASQAQQESAAAATAAGTTTTNTLEKANVALSRPPPDVGESAAAPSNGGGR